MTLPDLTEDELAEIVAPKPIGEPSMVLAKRKGRRR
jgi:hypothetical protein